MYAIGSPTVAECLQALGVPENRIMLELRRRLLPMGLRLIENTRDAITISDSRESEWQFIRGVADSSNLRLLEEACDYYCSDPKRDRSLVSRLFPRAECATRARRLFIELKHERRIRSTIPVTASWARKFSGLNER